MNRSVGLVSIVLIVLIVLLCPSHAFSAQVYGNLREGNQSVGRGVRVEVDCAGSEPYSAETDEYGSYSVYARTEGRCRLTVVYHGQRSHPFDVYSYRDPARYDFDLVRDAHGTYTLQRR